MAETGWAPALMREIAMSQTYPRYGARDFERRWQTRLNTLALSAVTVGFFAVTVSAFAWGLSDEDYDYLKTQQIERSDTPILDLSPKERQRLHNLINDPGTAGDPTVRNKNVNDALAIILEHQLWEKAHPGELWDAPKK
jgi:hypothetical protein